ncbi:MAG: sigma-54-dependent Fis family transcriptional regulator [Candidatus Dadabacteria bacterium]|nr:sigma-54-dependent Fis family transcriptional regulator [Candidatus Dadabacteria bacterium]
MINENILLLTKDMGLVGEVEYCLRSSGNDIMVSDVTENPRGAGVVLLDVDSLTIGGLSGLLENSFVIIITAHKGARYLIESMTFGAFDCVFRPLDGSKLVESVERALGIESELEGDKIGFPGENADSGAVTCAIVGNSPMLQEVCKVIGSVGRVDVPVLITGESGTGKDLVAESIWKVSTRWEGPFVVLNCAAIPETLLEAELFGYEKGSFTGATSARRGKFEEAGGGIIFLDEIGDMSLALQSKVLRVLQNGTFQRLGDNRELSADIRVIAATNKDLGELVRRGMFREDLYFRINVVNIHLPALRERKEDISLLVECFIQRHSSRAGKEIKGVTPRFIDKLMGYDWPGNIRELENAVRKAIAFSKSTCLTSYDLDVDSENMLKETFMEEPFYVPLRNSIKSLLASNGDEGGVYGHIMKEAERVVLEEALRASGGNRSKAARMLGINRLTLRRKVEEYGLEQ